MHLALLTIVFGCTPLETRHPSASPALDHDPDPPTAKRADTGLSVPTKAGQDGLTTQSAQPSGQRDGQVTSPEVEKPRKLTCSSRTLGPYTYRPGHVYKYVDQEGTIYFADTPILGSKYTLEWKRESCTLVRSKIAFKNIQLTENQIAEIKKGVGNRLRDPYSARYHSIQGVFVKSRSTESTIACGLVNAKNVYGGYVGKTPFFGYFAKPGGFSVVRMGGDLGDSRLILEECSAWGIKFDL